MKLPPTVPGGPEVLKPGRQININNLAGVTLLCHNPGLEMGPVKRVIGLVNQQNKLQHKSLKELVLQKRSKPEFESLQNYFDIRTCCTLVEQVGKEFTATAGWACRARSVRRPWPSPTPGAQTSQSTRILTLSN